MNVDNSNFQEAKKFIFERNLIQKSKAISFDFEFTGIKYENNERQRSQHFPFEKYKKMAKVVSKYAIIQCGLTFFTIEGGQIVAYPFNFYLFPRENILRDPVIALQGSAMQFNISQNMDWNRWINKGLTYVKITQISLLKPSPDKNINQAIENLQNQAKKTFDYLIDLLNKLQSGKKIQTVIPKINSYSIKKLLERHIQLKQLNFTIQISKQLIKNQPDKIKVIIEHISNQKKIQLKQKAQNDTQGFTQIFTKIWESPRTFIGHNCFYDILYMYEAFVAPLPEKYTEFKDELVLTNHKFYDTKCLVQLYQNSNDKFAQGTSLQQIYAYLLKNQSQLVNSKPKIVLKEGFQSYALENKILHEAGFDSYLTGWIYYKLIQKFSQKYFQKENQINCSRSYYQINLFKADTVKSDSKVFVYLLAGQEFVQKDELRKIKQQQMKMLKKIFTEEKLIHHVMLHDGMKQIYIDVKDNQKLKQIIEILQSFNKKTEKVVTLIRFVEIRAIYFTKNPDKM